MHNSQPNTCWNHAPLTLRVWSASKSANSYNLCSGVRVCVWYARLENCAFGVNAFEVRAIAFTRGWKIPAIINPSQAIFFAEIDWLMYFSNHNENPQLCHVETRHLRFFRISSRFWTRFRVANRTFCPWEQWQKIDFGKTFVQNNYPLSSGMSLYQNISLFQFSGNTTFY